MPNPYNSFYVEPSLSATYNDVNMQNQRHQQLLQQQAQLASDAGKSATNYSGLNALAMASMLRNKPTSNTDFLTSNYTAPSVGINPNATLGYNIDSFNGIGLK